VPTSSNDPSTAPSVRVVDLTAAGAARDPASDAASSAHGGDVGDGDQTAARHDARLGDSVAAPAGAAPPSQHGEAMSAGTAVVAAPPQVTGSISAARAVEAAHVPVQDHGAAQQLSAALRPLQQFVDGTHHLSIQLRPAELGTVTVELAMQGGELSLHLVAERTSTAHALRASVDELRADLEADGVRTGAFDIAQQYVGQHQQRRREAFTDVLDAMGSRLRSDVGAPPGPVAVPLDLRTPRKDGRLDVRI